MDGIVPRHTWRRLLLGGMVTALANQVLSYSTNMAEIHQEGAMNYALQSQEGGDNEVSLRQLGNRNTCSQYQMGNGLTGIDVTQIGNDYSITIVQLGP